MLVLDDPSGGATALAADVQGRLEALGVYRREGRPWLPHVTVVRFRERPRLRLEPPSDANVCSVRRGCLSITTASRRGAVRRPGIGWLRRLRGGQARSTGRSPRADRAPVRQGLGHEDERPRRGRDRLDLDGVARARPRARHRRAAARPHRRDLRAGVLGQDDARLPRDRRGAAARRHLRVHRRRARDGPAYAKRIGVDIDNLLVSQPDTGEQALEIAELLIRSGALDVVAIDSVAALTPKAEIEGEMGDSHVGLQARLMSQALRKLAGTLNRTDTICLFTNQLREKIGVMFGSPETTPGGRALKFYASIRLDIRRIETLKEGVEAIGNRIRVKVVKNKVAPPFKQAEFDIMYGTGISWEGTVLDVGIERKIVTKSGSYFSFGDERLGQGRQNATAFLKEHPDVTQQILQQIQLAGRAGAGRLGAAAARLVEEAEGNGAPSGKAAKSGRCGCGARGGRRGVRGGVAVPVVTALRERPRGRVEIDLDGASWRLVPADAVVRAGLSVGRALDRETARALGRELRRSEALDVALRALRYGDHSRSRLEARLASRGARPDSPGRRARDARAGRARRRRPGRRQPARQALAGRGYGDAAIRFALEGEGLAAAGRRRGARRARARARARPQAPRARGAEARKARPPARRQGFRRRRRSRTWADLRTGPDRATIEATLHPTFCLQTALFRTR